MVRSHATTVGEYLAQLPEERRAVVSVVRTVVLEHLPPGYVETMNWGMISYEVPLERHPETYNGQPLAYVALAAQKRHFSLYLMSVYSAPELERRLRAGFRKAGKRLDLGKSCLRFRRLEDLPLGLIGEIVAATSVEQTIAAHAARRHRAVHPTGA